MLYYTMLYNTIQLYYNNPTTIITVLNGRLCFSLMSHTVLCCISYYGIFRLTLSPYLLFRQMQGIHTH